MRRLPVTISEPQYHKLKALAEKTGLSMSEHIRRAVDQYLEKVNKQK